MPTSDPGKAIASRNATTHGLFARDVVLPSLGEDPDGYGRLLAEWTIQLAPRNLLELHYTEKIAAASWRLRRLHRWQAQLFEDDTLTEAERIDRLDKVLRHETALHRQIDTAVKMLGKDAPQLYTRRLRDQVLEDLHISDRECRDEPETDALVEMKMFDHLIRLREDTARSARDLRQAPLDTTPPDTASNEEAERCQNELPVALNNGGTKQTVSSLAPLVLGAVGRREMYSEPEFEKCENEPARGLSHPSRVREHFEPNYPYRPPTYHGPPGRKGRRATSGRGKP